MPVPIHEATPRWKRAQRVVADRLGRAKLDALIATLAEIETLHPSVTASAEASHGRR